MVPGAGGNCSSMSTSMTSIPSSGAPVLDVVARGPGGVDGTRSSMLFSSRSLSEQSEGVVTSVSLVESGRGKSERLEGGDISDDVVAACWLIPVDDCVIRRFAEPSSSCQNKFDVQDSEM